MKSKQRVARIKQENEVGGTLRLSDEFPVKLESDDALRIANRSQGGQKTTW